MATQSETPKPTSTQPSTAERERAERDKAAKGPEAQRSAGTLKEALYGNADAEAKAASDLEADAAETRKEAAQAELDAQQEDRDAGFATSAEEGPAKTKVVDPETGEVSAAEDAKS